MTGTYPSSSISMEVLIALEIVMPVWIILEVLHIPKDRPAPIFIAREDVYQPL